MNIYQAASIFGGNKARYKLERLYGLKIKSGLDPFYILVFIKIQMDGGTNYVQRKDVVDFFSHIPYIKAGERWVSKKLKELQEMGYIESHPRAKRNWRLSLQGEGVIRAYHESIVKTVNELMDTGALPDIYAEEWNEFVKIHRELKLKVR